MSGDNAGKPLLYTYWRSTAAYRVRIALNLKGIDYALAPVHLVRDGGEQHQAAFRDINPQGLVPALAIDDVVITQSMAIMEYLEETQPWPPLLPSRAADRARVRALATTIAADIHPLNNLRVLKFLKGDMGVSDEAKNQWYAHWIALGFEALERQLSAHPHTGTFCHGDEAGLADIFLVAQMYNAHRFKCDVSGYPTLNRICSAALELEAFADAVPERQPDAD
ncbi:MAG: maleylacetoacetate isomerase [Gammaproteobacteria bacterium]